MELLYPRDLLAQVIAKTPEAFDASAQATLSRLVDTVFFASLMIEEGEPVRVAVVYDAGGAAVIREMHDSVSDDDESAPQSAWSVATIEQRPFTPTNLAKLARGMKYGSQLAVVSGRAHELRIEAVARRNRSTTGGSVTRIAAPRPGVIVIEEGQREVLRFEAGQSIPSSIDLFWSDNPVRRAVGAITGDGLHSDQGATFTEIGLDSLLREMRATGAGGIFALLPRMPESSTLSAVKYRRLEPNLLWEAIRAKGSKVFASIMASHKAGTDPTSASVERLRRKREEADVARLSLTDAIEDVAQLSAIDGAVLAGPPLAIYGGGYMISGDKPPIARLARNAAGTDLIDMDPHGARHTAAITFAYNHPGGVAFVVSEDGPVKCALRVGDEVIVWPIRIAET